MQTAACMLSMQSSSWSKSKGMLHARLRWLCFEQTSPFSADSKKSIQCWVDNYIRQSLLDSWIHRTQVMRCCQKLVIPCRITKSQMLIHEHASVTAVRFLQYQSSNNNPSCTPASFTATIQTVLQYTDLQTCCCFSTGGDNCSDAQIFVCVLASCSCQSINLTSRDVHMVIMLNLSI